MDHAHLSMLVWFGTPSFVNAAGYDYIEYFMLEKYKFFSTCHSASSSLLVKIASNLRGKKDR
jgi:hypothetical protein